MMTLRWVFIAMYHAAKTLNEEREEEELDFWVDDANPYVWGDLVSVIPQVQEDFFEYAASQGLERESYGPDESYDLVLSYVHARMSWGSRFDDITREEWARLCELVEEDERSYFPIHVETFGAWVHRRCLPATMKGKTIKSIEYVRVDGEAKARGALQINLGRAAGRVRCLPWGSSWPGSNNKGMRIFVRDYPLDAPFAPEGGGTPHAYMVDEVVTGVELILYAVGADGYDGILSVHMGFTLRTRYGVHSFYRRGMESDLIYVADHVPTDEELGMDEVAAFWSAGVTGFTIVRDDWAL